MRQWVTCLICVLMLCCSTSGVSRHAANPAGLISATKDAPLEVRMRRLHLARPDLIPYPLDIEVVC